MVSPGWTNHSHNETLFPGHVSQGNIVSQQSFPMVGKPGNMVS